MLIFDYDIRGIFPDELNYEIIQKCFEGFLRFVKEEKIILAIDSNKKSILIRDFLLKNFKNLIYLGKLPTPIFYYEVIKRKTPGIIITASHLPRKYAGIKFLLKDGNSWKPRKINF